MAKGTRYLKYSLHIAVVAGIIWAGVRTLDGDDFARALKSFDWRLAPLVCILGFTSVCIKAWRFASMLQQVSDLDRMTVIKAYISGQAVTLLPGGIAARAGLLKQAGVPVSRSSPAITMSSVTDQLGFIVCGIVASMWFQQARKPVLTLLALLTVICLVLGIEATRTWLVQIVEKLLGRFSLETKWHQFVDGMTRTLTRRVILVGILNTLMSFTCLVAALGLCMKGVDRPIPALVLLLAFAVPTMLGRISALPGGFGITEVGMVGVLDRAPGVRLDQAAAAVLVFRLGTVVFSALCGGIVYFAFWRHGHDPKQKSAVAA